MSSSLAMKKFEGREQAFHKVVSHKIMQFANLKTGNRYQVGHHACHEENILKVSNALSRSAYWRMLSEFSQYFKILGESIKCKWLVRTFGWYIRLLLDHALVDICLFELILYMYFTVISYGHVGTLPSFYGTCTQN